MIRDFTNSRYDAELVPGLGACSLSEALDDVETPAHNPWYIPLILLRRSHGASLQALSQRSQRSDLILEHRTWPTKSACLHCT